MQEKQPLKIPLDALDGAERYPYPNPEWQKVALESMVQALLAFDFTVQETINPTRLRTISRAFCEKANAIRNTFDSGSGCYTWEEMRQYCLKLADLFQTSAIAILERKCDGKEKTTG